MSSLTLRRGQFEAEVVAHLRRGSAAEPSGRVEDVSDILETGVLRTDTLRTEVS